MSSSFFFFLSFWTVLLFMALLWNFISMLNPLKSHKGLLRGRGMFICSQSNTQTVEVGSTTKLKFSCSASQPINLVSKWPKMHWFTYLCYNPWWPWAQEAVFFFKTLKQSIVMQRKEKFHPEGRVDAKRPMWSIGSSLYGITSKR